MFRAHVLGSQAIRFFRGKRQNPFRSSAERHFHRSGNAFADGDPGFNFFADGFDGALRTQLAVGKAFVFAHQTEQQMLCLDARASVLAGLVTREEYYPTRLFCESFQHGSLGSPLSSRSENRFPVPTVSARPSLTKVLGHSARPAPDYAWRVWM